MIDMTVRARLAAGIGVGALAVASLGMTAGTASAAPESAAPWDAENARLTMTVSDSTPKVGDTITLRADFQRKLSLMHISKVKQLVPSCLEYVDGSAAWQGTPVAKVTDHASTGAGDQAYVLAESAAWNSWQVPGIGGSYGEKRGVAMQFTVTQACATGVAMPTSVHYTASIAAASGSPQDRGPSITVAKSTGGGNNGGGSNGGGNNGGGSNGGDTGGGDNGGGSSDGGSTGGTGTGGTGDTGNGNGNNGGNTGNVGGAGSLDFGSLS